MKTLIPRQEYATKCFDAALEVAAENRDAVVVHGWLHSQEHWLLHAWCEIDEWVIDLTETREPIDKSVYYRTMGVSPERSIRYNRWDFFALAAEHGHFGPFDKAFFFAEKSSADPVEIKQAGKLKEIDGKKA